MPKVSRTNNFGFSEEVEISEQEAENIRLQNQVAEYEAELAIRKRTTGQTILAWIGTFAGWIVSWVSVIFATLVVLGSLWYIGLLPEWLMNTFFRAFFS